jgi:hypothetical protein
MKYINALLFLLIFSLSVYLSNIYLSNYVFPNTYIGSIDISGKTKPEIKKFLNHQTNKKINIKVNKRIYRFYYSDLGVILPKEDTLNKILKPNEHFLLKYINYFKSFNSENIIAPPIKFSQHFYETINQSVFTFVDPKTNETKNYQIDIETLKTQIILNFGKNTTIDTIVLVEKNKDIDPVLMAQRVNRVFEQPIEIMVSQEESLRNIPLEKAEVKGISTVRMNPENANVEINVDKADLKKTLTKKDELLKHQDINEESIGENLEMLVKNRLEGINLDLIVTEDEKKPNTNGKVKDKYIEIDLSARTIFLFEGGFVKSKHRIISDICQEIKKGELKVTAKIDKVHSKGNKKWINNWLKLNLKKDKVDFGIGEIPYTKENEEIDNQEIYSRDNCISLPINDSKLVYDFAEDNLSVYIFE